MEKIDIYCIVTMSFVFILLIIMIAMYHYLMDKYTYLTSNLISINHDVVRNANEISSNAIELAIDSVERCNDQMAGIISELSAETEIHIDQYNDDEDVD